MTSVPKTENRMMKLK